MRKFLQIFPLLFLLPLVIFSQNDSIELQNKINSATGTEKIDLLLQAAENKIDKNTDEAAQECNEALKAAKELDYKNGIANALFLLGQISYKQKEFVEALNKYEEALSYLSKSNPTQIFAEILSSISEIYLTSGIYDKAIENYLSLLDFYKNKGNKTGEAYTLSYIGKAYTDLQNADNALKYLNEALAIAEDINDRERISFILNTIGGVYVDVLKDNQTAEEYYNRALNISQEINYSLGIAKAHHNLGLVYYNKGDLQKALELHKKSLDIVTKSGITEGLAYNFNSIAKIYLELGQTDSAIEYFNNSLEISKKEQITLMVAENYKGLSDSYKKKNNFKASLNFLELYNESREKLNNEKAKQRIAELEIQYETKRKDSENEILKRSNTIQRNYFIFSVVLGLLIVIVLLNRYWYSRKSHKQLEELNATKDKLFSIIGHDLKNPFGTLINFSEMLVEDYQELTDEEKITYINMINEASQTGHEILDNLLQWSKTQSGKLEFLPQEIKLGEIVEDNITLLKSSASNKGINIFSTVNGGTKVLADKIMLKTVLRNLIGNAIKFSHEGGTIKISSATKNNFVEVVVSDNGVGMKEEIKAKLFNPTIFHSTAGTANEQGTGLGLLLCKEFVERNGGKIWVESREGEGSDFKFSIPIYS